MTSKSKFDDIDQGIHTFVSEESGELSEEGWAFTAKAVTGIVTAVLRKQNVSAWRIEELLQEAFTKLIATDWRKIKSPVSYILTVVNNLRIDFVRKDMRRKEVSLELDIGSPLMLWEETERAAVFRAIKALPNPDRVVLVLKFQLGWSVREIADALGVSKSSVSNISIRAIKKIRNSL